MRRLSKALFVMAGSAALLGTSVLQAAGRRSEPVQIPFDFVVQGKQLPAGTYRLQREAGDRIEALVNLRTGQQVQMLRSLGGDGGKVKLQFERQGNTYFLRKLS